MADPKPEKPRGRGYLGLIAPFAVVLLALAAWTVWWFVAANRIDARIDDTVRDLGRAGYKVTWRERSLTGWPFRSFVQFHDFRIQAPGGASLSAPELAAEANTYAL